MCCVSKYSERTRERESERASVAIYQLSVYCNMEEHEKEEA